MSEENKSILFPLTKNEARLIYDELQNHWFSRDHPYYHYSDSLMERLRRFVYGRDED